MGATVVRTADDVAIDQMEGGLSNQPTHRLRNHVLVGSGSLSPSYGSVRPEVAL
jgi:hypothetical protein